VTSPTPPDRDRHGHPDGVPVPRPGLDDRLFEVLERSRDLGFLGPGDIRTHVHHAAAFLPGLEEAGPQQTVLDLGSGGGVPGLVLAVRRPDLSFILVDASERRTEFLTWAADRLEVAHRISVVRGRAEDLARTVELRGVVDVVTARSFGSPPVTVECAIGFLRGPGSRLLVSEPPNGDGSRWPIGALADVGLRPGATWTVDGATVTGLEVFAPCPDALPRRVGVPSRRPLFSPARVAGPE